MNKNNTYRSFVAFFLAALIIQVFVLKGLHQCIEHDDELETYSVNGTYIHAEGHEHVTCHICLFHFSPIDLSDCILAIQLPAIAFNKSQFTYRQSRIVQKLRQAYLRGPPLTCHSH